MSRFLTFGIQGPDGQKRVKISETSLTSDLYIAVQEAYELSAETGFFLTQDKYKSLVIDNSKLCAVSEYQLKHGDRLFLHYTIDPQESSSFSQALDFLRSSSENSNGQGAVPETSTGCRLVSNTNTEDNIGNDKTFCTLSSSCSDATPTDQIVAAQLDKSALNQQVDVVNLLECP